MNLQKRLTSYNAYDLIVDIDSRTPSINLGWKLVLNYNEDENEEYDNEDGLYYDCELYIPENAVFHANNIVFNYSHYFDSVVMCYKYGDKELNICIDDEQCSIINQEHFNINEVYVYNSRYQSIQHSNVNSFNLYYNNVLTTKGNDGNLHSIIFTMKDLELNSIYVSNDFKIPKRIENTDERGVYELGTIVEVYGDALACYNIYGKCEDLTTLFKHLVNSEIPLTSPGYGAPPKIIITDITGDSKTLCDTFKNVNTTEFLNNDFEFPQIEVLINNKGIIQN